MPTAQKSKPAAKAAASVAAKPLKKGDHVFLVDGSGYIFRAYHALPPINRKSDGLQLNAVFGFCNMLWKLLREMKDNKPTPLAVVFDLSEKTFRTEMYPDYKAHRPDPPDDLIPQFAFIREAVRAFDLPCLEQAGFEAHPPVCVRALARGRQRHHRVDRQAPDAALELLRGNVLHHEGPPHRHPGRD